MEKEPHIFVSPEVVETHIQKEIPLPAGTAKLLWVISQLFNENIKGEQWKL